MTQLSIEKVKEIADLLEQDIKVRHATIDYLESLRWEVKHVTNLEAAIQMEEKALGHAVAMISHIKAIYSAQS